MLEDDIVRYVSIENFKHENPLLMEQNQDLDSTSILSILVHSSVPFGFQNASVLAACSKRACRRGSDVGADAVIQAMLNSVSKANVLPALSGLSPVKVLLHGWEHSQVSRNYYAASNNTSVVTPVPASSSWATESAIGVGGGVGTAQTTNIDTSRGVLLQQHSGAKTNDTVGTFTESKEESATAHTPTAAAAIVIPIKQPTSARPANKNAQYSSSHPLLILAGDAFTESNFEGCLKSAKYAAQSIVEHLQ